MAFANFAQLDGATYAANLPPGNVLRVAERDVAAFLFESVRTHHPWSVTTCNMTRFVLFWYGCDCCCEYGRVTTAAEG